MSIRIGCARSLLAPSPGRHATAAQTVSLAIDGLPGAAGAACATPRGRYRPGLPMLGLSFRTGRGPVACHLVLRDRDDMDLSQEPQLTDCDPATVFAVERFSYELAGALSGIYLRSRRARVGLCIDDNPEQWTDALIVEDFGHARKSRGAGDIADASPRFEAADLLNLHLIQALTGNADFQFDFDAQGRFHRHNVAVFVLGESWVPVPFDFQFSVFAVPAQRRYLPGGPPVYARQAGAHIASLLARLPGDDAAVFVAGAIAHARQLSATYVEAPLLRAIYADYLELLAEAAGVPRPTHVNLKESACAD